LKINKDLVAGGLKNKLKINKDLVATSINELFRQKEIQRKSNKKWYLAA
jgi:hypothetical protein